LRGFLNAHAISKLVSDPGIPGSRADLLVTAGPIWRIPGLYFARTGAGVDWLERLLSPYIVASQSVPVVAIAPLLVIWFGAGLLSKVLIAALIVFFPVLINTVVGLRSVPTGFRDLMRSFQASSWQTFRLLEVPAAMPIFLGGLKVGATLAVIGAVALLEARLLSWQKKD